MDCPRLNVELYDPIAGTFTLAGNMNAPRSNHTATLLNDGRVLMAEGVSDSFTMRVKYRGELSALSEL